VLAGTEVKSCARFGQSETLMGSLRTANCAAELPYRPYDHGNSANHAALRTRKLLGAQGRNSQAIGRSSKGLTLIPTRCISERENQVELALAKGKQLWTSGNRAAADGG